MAERRCRRTREKQDSMTMTTRSFTAAYAGAMMFLALGCGLSGTAPPIEDEPRPLSEWKKVVQVSQEGGLTVRQHVGYLNKLYSEADPEGIVYVLDTRRTRIGFVLPTGQAYAYDIELQMVAGKRDLGNYGFDNGVKNVLGLPGSTLEYEPLVETGGAGASSASSPSRSGSG